MEPGLTECEREGLSGNCGPDCPVFIAGDCGEEKTVEEMIAEDWIGE